MKRSKRIHARLAKQTKSEPARHASFPQLNPNPIVDVDLDGRIHYLNPAAERLFPDLRQHGILHPWLADWESIANEFRNPAARKYTREAAVDGNSYNQTMFFVEEIERIRIYGLDITESKKRESELQRLNRTLKALRDSSQAISCALRESDILDAVCRIVVEDCGHKLVWIGFAEEDEGKSVRPVAFAGFEKGYLETLHLSLADSERGRGPTGTAIRRGRPTVCRNMLGDPRFKPWREEAIKRGYVSSLALPLMAGEKAFGAITIYSKEADPFSNEEVRLLSELAHDLAYGITAVRIRLAHAQAEEQLRLHSTILESTANAIVIAGRDGIIQWVNPAFTQLTGYSFAEIIGQNPRVFKSGLQDSNFYLDFWETILAGRVWHGELVNKRKDGSLYTEEMTITPVADACGGIAHFIAVKQDVTQRKLMEDNLRSAKEAAEAANVAKSRFIANISHELRTPMNAILGMTELALGEELPPSVRDYLATAKESADLLLELLNEILDFSRLEAVQFQVEPAPFSLRRMLAHTLKTLGVQAYEKGLELICDVTDHVPDQLLGDSLRLCQVLTNLIGNAIKFTTRGEIVVSVAEDREAEWEAGKEASNGSLAATDGSLAATGHRPKVGRGARSVAKEAEEGDLLLKFSIEDTGIGIAPQEQERIFAPFAQADTSLTRNYGGAGLGLAIASNLVKQMGGRIRVESQLGRGSIFSFTVRLKRQPAFTTESEADLARRERLRGLPILLVADNPTVRRILQTMLLRWGMKPDAVSDVPAALVKLHEAAAGQVFPVAIVDVSRSPNDGYTLASWIKSNPGLVGTAILPFSPCDRAAHVHRCRELGARFLEKPVFQSNLLNMIFRAVGLTDSPPPILPATAPSIEPPSAVQAKRILIVEDNLANRQLALRILDKRGHSTAVAANGLEAVERVRREDFNAVLMDIQMPVMDGYQATAAIRALTDPAKARLPIIAMTAHAMKGDRQRCLAAGMDGYLNKPVNAEKMIEIIERLAEKPPAAFPPESISQALPSAAVSEDVFNLQEALARCFDREMFDQMREYFFTQSAEVLEQMRGGLARGAAGEIARSAHALRGTLVYLGSHSCLDAVERVEQMGLSGDLTAAAESIERLAIQIGLLKKALGLANQ